MFKVNNGNTRKMCKACFKLKTKVNTATSYSVVLVSLLLTLSRFHTLCWCSYCWLWLRKSNHEKMNQLTRSTFKQAFIKKTQCRYQLVFILFNSFFLHVHSVYFKNNIQLYLTSFTLTENYRAQALI